MRFCSTPRCPNKVEHGKCPTCRGETDKVRNSDAYRALYATTRWRKLSKMRLARHPWCVGYPPGIHGAVGRLAQCTDHIKPARWFPELFYDPENLQSLCDTCNSAKRNDEEGGFGRIPLK